MKTKIQFILLLISFSFFSCNNTTKKPAVSMSNLETDFPTTEKLEFKPFGDYNITENGACVIEDSVLWCINMGGTADLGSCYNLHTREKLSTIALKGRAANELTELEGLTTVGDSIQFYTYGNREIKSFAKKDIINNVPMGERGFSITTIPDSILISRMIKLPNGSVLATIRPALSDYQKAVQTNVVNQKSVVIFNDKEANAYETIDYESFNIEKAKGRELSANDLIKATYAEAYIAIKDNDMAVFSVYDQFILYTFDINNGKVVNEKRYTKMQRGKVRDEHYISTSAINDRKLAIDDIINNDKYILCRVSGYLSEEDKKTKLYKKAIFVFDWDLNPIKKFDLPKRENGYYVISNDCKSVYICENNEDGLTLYKADLNI